MEMTKIKPPVQAVSALEKKQRAKASKALSNAIQRCTNPNNKDYKNYGALGIKVLISLDELIAEIGLPPMNMSLDRIDPNGHYESGNVRWASPAVQAANKKSLPGGSVLPLATLITQQKNIVAQEKQRPRVAEAWYILTKALNRGGLPQSQDHRLIELLSLNESAVATFGCREKNLDGITQTIFRLPSLTKPSAIVEGRGALKPAPDGKGHYFDAQGLLHGLYVMQGAVNVPSTVQAAIEELRASDDCPGLTLVGRPSDDDLGSGWFEIWMLAAASRLPSLGVQTTFFPVMTVLDTLNELGGPGHWHKVCDPILDRHLLFIPDFQLDCGPWGSLDPYEFGKLANLLRYRSEVGHKTVVGVQAPNKLNLQLQKILLGMFGIRNIPNGTSP